MLWESAVSSPQRTLAPRPQRYCVASSGVHGELAPRWVALALALALVLPGLGKGAAGVEGGGVPAFLVVGPVLMLQGIRRAASAPRGLQLRGERARAFPDPHLADASAANQPGVSVRDEACG